MSYSEPQFSFEQRNRRHYKILTFNKTFYHVLEEESSEPESGCAGGPSNTATRGGSASGSSGDDAASETAEPDSEPDEATPRGAILTHLAHALDALEALAGAASTPPQAPPEP